MSVVRTKDILENFDIKLIAGNEGIQREIIKSDISRPALEMTGYFKFYPKERLQLIGRTEMAYYLALSEEKQVSRMERLCTDITPGIIVSRNMDIPDLMIKIAN